MRSYIASLIAQHSRAGVLIDTSLLLLLIIGGLRVELVETFRRTNNHFVADDYIQLSDLIRPLSVIVTTSLIFTEVSNFVDSLDDPDKASAFERLADLSHFDVRDIPLPILVSAPAFRLYGLSDAAIVHLARHGVLVITIDTPLHGYISKMGIECVNYNHISLADAR